MSCSVGSYRLASFVDILSPDIYANYSFYFFIYWFSLYFRLALNDAQTSLCVRVTHSRTRLPIKYRFHVGRGMHENEMWIIIIMNYRYIFYAHKHTHTSYTTNYLFYNSISLMSPVLSFLFVLFLFQEYDVHEMYAAKLIKFRYKWHRRIYISEGCKLCQRISYIRTFSCDYSTETSSNGNNINNNNNHSYELRLSLPINLFKRFANKSLESEIRSLNCVCVLWVSEIARVCVCVRCARLLLHTHALFVSRTCICHQTNNSWIEE